MTDPGDKNDPVCYVQKSSPIMAATISVLPVVPGLSMPAKIRAVSTDPALTYESPFSITGAETNVSGLSTSKVLSSTVLNTALALAWTFSLDDGSSYWLLSTTTHQLMQTWATPIISDSSGFSDPTAKRMAEVTARANGKDSVDSIGEAIGTVTGARYDNTQSQITAPWATLDGNNTADCVSLSTLMKLELDALGCGGAQVKVVTARNSSWTGVSQSFDFKNPPQLEASPSDSTNTLWMYIPAPWPMNRFEGCCVFNNKWWMGGTGSAVSSDKEVLAKMTCPNNAQCDSKTTVARQAWRSAPLVAVKYPDPPITCNPSGCSN